MAARHFVLTVLDDTDFGSDLLIGELNRLHRKGAIQRVEVEPKIWRAGPLEQKLAAAMVAQMRKEGRANG